MNRTSKKLIREPTNHNNFLVIIAGMALKLFFKFKSMSFLTIRKNRRQKKISVPKYSLEKQKWTIIFQPRPQGFSLKKRKKPWERA